jgi:thiamine-phosphate pyrophosphorylase
VGVLDPQEATLRRRLESARLYAITPDADPSRVRELVSAYLRGGVDMVQLRHKSLARGALLELAADLAAEVHAAGRILIVNDHADIARLSGADGVHLGDDDLSVEAARRMLGPDLLVGASASTPAAARRKVAAGADHLGAGPAFPTPLKADKVAAGPVGIAAVATAVPVPVFAIGGITKENLDRLLAAGIRRVCLIRGLAEAADPEAATRSLRRILYA